MKNHLLLIILVFGSLLGTASTANAQTIELVAGNTLNGAMNGVILGGASMALANSEDFRPVEVGLGAGTLYGLGVGVYDVSRVSTGQQFYKSGTFNDGTNSSVIVLLDTFYGIAGGALVASSVALIVKEPILNALRYGAGIGAWTGFGFGLIDAFLLAKGPNYSSTTSISNTGMDGMITYNNASKTVKAGFLSPSMITQKEISKKTLCKTISPTLRLLHLQIAL